jgi:hypothetical protein
MPQAICATLPLLEDSGRVEADLGKAAYSYPMLNPGRMTRLFNNDHF